MLVRSQSNIFPQTQSRPHVDALAVPRAARDIRALLPSVLSRTLVFSCRPRWCERRRLVSGSAISCIKCSSRSRFLVSCSLFWFEKSLSRLQHLTDTDHIGYFNIQQHSHLDIRPTWRCFYFQEYTHVLFSIDSIDFPDFPRHIVVILALMEGCLVNLMKE